ncbi:MAG: alpha/beta hydrolase [Acidimicrobiia bacterium]
MARRWWAMVLVLALMGCANSVPGRTAAPRQSSTSGPKSTTTSRRPTPVLDWKSCDAGECATLPVPEDYRKPDGTTIDLAVARSSKARDGQRIGSLVVNPGGPGASGVDIASYVSSSLPRSVTDRFDVVGWDPRGTGASRPVDCGDHLDYLFDVDTAPDAPGELAALEGSARRFVAGCVAGSGDLLRHISSVDTVRDLDQLRTALGDAQLTYLGLSYGTYIGGLYASMFPDRVRALVLDGAVDPQLSVADVAIQQAKGFGNGLDAFFVWCRDHTACRFHHDGDPAAAYAALARRIDARPIAADGRTFGPTQLDVAVAAFLYSGAAAYRQLADGLRDLERGVIGSLAVSFDEYMGRKGETYNSEWPAFIAISCADGPNLTLTEVEAAQQRAAVEAPQFGAGNIGLNFPCSYWPYPPTRTAPFALSAPTAAPIVVVGTTGDPVTPLALAQGLARELGSGRLVTVTGSTHTATLNGNGCLDAIITRYLVDLEAPKAGATCG